MQLLLSLGLRDLMLRWCNYMIELAMRKIKPIIELIEKNCVENKKDLEKSQALNSKQNIRINSDESMGSD